MNIEHSYEFEEQVKSDPTEIMNDIVESKVTVAAILSHLTEEEKYFKKEKKYELRKELKRQNRYTTEKALEEELENYKYEPDDISVIKTVKGELFEAMLRREEKMLPEVTPLEKELASLIENPNRYNLQEILDIKRRPDTLYTKISEEGQLIIKGAGEAKSARLNERALDQILTFEDNIKKIADFIDKATPEELEKYGLAELSKAKKEWNEKQEYLKEEDRKPLLVINPHFRVTLIVPSDRDTGYKDMVGKTLQETFSKKDYERLMKNKVNIKRSKFSTTDISDTAHRVMKKLG